MKSVRLVIWIIGVLFLTAGCVYYNTFFHAKQSFNEAESARKKSPEGRQTIRTSEYQRAIDKSLKVVEEHPKSKYYDDALYVLTVSYYYTKEYRKSERRAQELLTNYPNANYLLEARLYLAKSRLEQLETDAAMDIFTELFESKVDRSVKMEAAFALGNFHFEKKRFNDARRFFLAIRDSLGNDLERKSAQQFIADSYFIQLKYQDALSAYLQMLGMDPSREEKYHALFRAAECSYRLFRIRDGRDYLTTLSKDDVYYDSSGVLKIALAEGYELEGDLDHAVSLYQEVVASEKIKKVTAEANYILGLINQFDYDDLNEAKKYYDQVVTLDKSSEIGHDALQRSSDIGKLESYKRTDLDSTASQDDIDNVAYTQFQLAELFWLKLNKPDSAMMEMQYIIDSFPTAYDAPKAMISLAEMTRDNSGDSARAESILTEMLHRYPHSDYVPQALEALHLQGTTTDTGYALHYIEVAENFLLDDDNIDSARYYYQYVVDNFEGSQYYLQARFSLIFVTDVYAPPGDSSLIYAYQEFIDSFPNSDWSAEAIARLRSSSAVNQSAEPFDTLLTDVDQFANDSLGDTSEYYDPLRALYNAPDGSQALDLPGEVRPLETREPFIYPTEAYADAWYGDIVFQIRLDFTGEVTEYKRVTSSGIQEMDRRAEEALASTRFDSRLLRPEYQDLWFVYRYRVDLPPNLR